MRPQKIVDSDLLISLSKVFRAKGYEGTSIAELSEGTGLKKASLYHRFPKGKQEMAESVLAYLDEWVTENIFQIINDESLAPQERLKSALLQVNVLYNDGNESCIFNAFSRKAGLDLFAQNIHYGMTQWTQAFTKIGISLNLNPTKARENAIQTLIEIQGSLNVSKGLNDISIFQNTLKNIEFRYLNS